MKLNCIRTRATGSSDDGGGGGRREGGRRGKGTDLGVEGLRRVDGEGPAAEVGEGGDGGGGEDLGAGGGGGVGRPVQGRGVGRLRRPAGGGVVDAAAAPLERECEEGEREREGR